MLPNVTAEPRNKKTYKKAAMALWLLHIDDFSKDTLGDKHFPHDEIVSFSHQENFQISTQGRVYLSRQYFRDDIQMICRLRVLYSRIFQPAESDDLRALSTFATRHQTDENREWRLTLPMFGIISSRLGLLFV
jgi:hypothetical protein